MAEIDTVMEQNRTIALYGLGTETERFLAEYRGTAAIIGLLDGFREEGELYGYPIIPIDACISAGVGAIIVIARPGSCKAITRRIASFCREHQIALYDVRGRDLLAASQTAYHFSDIKGCSRRTLSERIEKADIISFDLFDTLVTRKVLVYTDIFELLDLRLKDRGIVIPDLPKRRLFAEKELSRQKAPSLEEIYDAVMAQCNGGRIASSVPAYRSGIGMHDIVDGNGGGLTSSVPAHGNGIGMYDIVDDNGSGLASSFLAQMEWDLDLDTIIARRDVCEMLKQIISESAGHRKVVITTDSYYSREQIQCILDKVGIHGVDRILVSSQYGTSKTQGLFEVLKDAYPGGRILHIGDDETADIMQACKYGLDACRIYKGEDLFDHLGGLSLEGEMKTLCDRIKVGMFVAEMFNSPFWFEDEKQGLSVGRSFQIGYLFCAPMITDFVLWLKGKVKDLGYRQILFCARDGYLPCKLFEKISPEMGSIYFLTSRTAAIRAGVENALDLEYVSSMKYFGTPEEALRARFGITEEEVLKACIGITAADMPRETMGEKSDVVLVGAVGGMYGIRPEGDRHKPVRFEELDTDHTCAVDGTYGIGIRPDDARYKLTFLEEEIQNRAKRQRVHYQRYIKKLDIQNGSVGMFDFVAKGTTQMYLERLFPQHIKGFYFLQLEPEFMADKGLDIEPYYSDAEKNTSAIFDNYYILETILTSPYPQVEEFDDEGEPVFAKETRSEADIRVIEQAQAGIAAYFEDYLSLVPESERVVNKKLDENMLALVNRVKIGDKDFMDLKVEDPFFGRMTPVMDVMG